MSYVKKALLALLVSLPLNAIPGITTVTNNPIKASAVATVALGGALLAQAKMTHKKGTSFGKHLTKLLISAKNNPTKNPLFTATVTAFIAAGGSLTALVAKDTITTYQTGRRAQNQTIKENKTPADKTLDKKTQDLIEAGKKMNSAETQALIEAGNKMNSTETQALIATGKKFATQEKVTSHIHTKAPIYFAQEINRTIINALSYEIDLLKVDYIKNEAQIKKIKAKIEELEKDEYKKREELFEEEKDSKLSLDVQGQALLENDLISPENKLEIFREFTQNSLDNLKMQESSAFHDIKRNFEVDFELLATEAETEARTKKTEENKERNEALKLERFKYMVEEAAARYKIENEAEEAVEKLINDFHIKAEEIFKENTIDIAAFETHRQKQAEISRKKEEAEEKNQEALYAARREEEQTQQAKYRAQREKEEAQREKEEAQRKALNIKKYGKANPTWDETSDIERQRENKKHIARNAEEERIHQRKAKILDEVAQTTGIGSHYLYRTLSK